MKYLTPQQAATRMRLSVRHIRRMCDAGQLPGAIKRGNFWAIPTTAHPLLHDYNSPEKLTAQLELAGVPETKKEAALKKLGAIQQFEKFAREFVPTAGRCDALEVYAAQQSIAPRTLRRWISSYRKYGLAGLIDKRGRTSAEQLITPEIEECFCRFYLTQQKLDIPVCVKLVHHINETEGHGWQVPSLRTFQRFVKERLPLPVRILRREGQAAYEAKCAPYIETDLAAIEPGSVWIGDHHECNCFVWHKNKLIRPWLTAWMDMRSRTLVGWHISAAPNSTTILRAFKHGAEQYGPPSAVKIDNGKDYDSRLFTGTTKAKRRKALKAGYIDEPLFAGIYAMLAISVSFSIAYHPQSKAIERLFDTVDRQFVKLQPAYCGKTTWTRPDYLAAYLKSGRAKAEVPTLEQFIDQADRWIAEVYNNQPHTGREMAGRSPLAVMATRTVRRVIDREVLQLLLRVWTPAQKLGKNGIRINGLWYGQYDELLHLKNGALVRAAYDPDDMSKVWVYDAHTLRLIGVAHQAQLVAYTGGGNADPVAEQAIREAHAARNRARRVVRRYAPARRIADSDLAALAIDAQASAIDEKHDPDAALAAIQPVNTPASRALGLGPDLAPRRRAAGAEGQGQRLTIPAPPPKNAPARRLFND